MSKVSKVDTRSLTTVLFLLLKSSPLNIRETKRLRAENLGPLVRPHPHSLRSADVNEKDRTEYDLTFLCSEYAAYKSVNLEHGF